MRKKLEVLGWAELVVERYQHAAAVEDGIGGNQPFGLIRHDDRGAIIGVEVGVFQCAGEGKGDFLEIGVGESEFFAISFGFDQTHFFREALESVTKSGAE